MGKHKLIPDMLQPEQIKPWLQNNAREKFQDEAKVIFSDEDINTFAKTSSQKGGELMDLQDIAAQVNIALKKGVSEGLVIDIPPTAGTEMLLRERHELDSKVKKGYELVQQEIYGIVDDENETMVFFNGMGEEIADRTRPLSAKEKNDYIGLFSPSLRQAANQ
jgi:hypothetical protein